MVDAIYSKINKRKNLELVMKVKGTKSIVCQYRIECYSTLLDLQKKKI
jgi:hypothetical protein